MWHFFINIYIYINIYFSSIPTRKWTTLPTFYNMGVNLSFRKWRTQLVTWIFRAPKSNPTLWSDSSSLYDYYWLDLLLQKIQRNQFRIILVLIVCTLKTKTPQTQFFFSWRGYVQRNALKFEWVLSLMLRPCTWMSLLWSFGLNNKSI